jgi:hypothetical protein
LFARRNGPRAKGAVERSGGRELTDRLSFASGLIVVRALKSHEWSSRRGRGGTQRGRGVTKGASSRSSSLSSELGNCETERDD